MAEEMKRNEYSERCVKQRENRSMETMEGKQE